MGVSITVEVDSFEELEALRSEGAPECHYTYSTWASLLNHVGLWNGSQGLIDDQGLAEGPSSDAAWEDIYCGEIEPDVLLDHLTFPLATFDCDDELQRKLCQVAMYVGMVAIVAQRLGRKVVWS